jgi:hypothetical protein
MKAQVCRLCHTAHFNNEPHKWEKAEPRMVTPIVNRPVDVPCAGCAVRDKRIEKLTAELLATKGELLAMLVVNSELTVSTKPANAANKPANTNSELTVSSKPANRNAYQREYMRKRREAEKRAT